MLVDRSKHWQIFCRGVLSYGEIYIGKGSLWFRLFFILLPFLFIIMPRNEKSSGILIYQYDKWLCKTVHDLCWFDLYGQNNQLIVNFILCQGNLKRTTQQKTRSTYIVVYFFKLVICPVIRVFPLIESLI
jgi:hypothetical protein